jgi:aryl-alcohol dehydrogenase-like predicted oxidoreductase
MRTIPLPNTNLTVSKLSFGTASLHHIFSSQQRRTLLSSAVDAGFTHFDTSPLYGYGIGEAALGQLSSTIKHQITIASKVGLYPPPGASTNIASVMLRKIAGKMRSELSAPAINWSVTAAQNSLDNTLRRLQRDYLDILFLHEPESSLIHTDEWKNWLITRVQAGQIRHWGIAGEVERINAMLLSSPELAPIIQVRDSLDRQQSETLTSQRPRQFTYGYLAHSPAEITPKEVIQRACQRNTTGSIIVSTRKFNRVAELASYVDA